MSGALATPAATSSTATRAQLQPRPPRSRRRGVRERAWRAGPPRCLRTAGTRPATAAWRRPTTRPWWTATRSRTCSTGSSYYAVPVQPYANHTVHHARGAGRASQPRCELCRRLACGATSKPQSEAPVPVGQAWRQISYHFSWRSGRSATPRASRRGQLSRRRCFRRSREFGWRTCALRSKSCHWLSSKKRCYIFLFGVFWCLLSYMVALPPSQCNRLLGPWLFNF